MVGALKPNSWGIISPEELSHDELDFPGLELCELALVIQSCTVRPDFSNEMTNKLPDRGHISLIKCDSNILLTLTQQPVNNSNQLRYSLWKMIDLADDSNPLDRSPEPVIASDYVRV